MRSSTSSSDPVTHVPRVGFPWAFAGALVIVGLVELGVRFTEPRALIPYDYGENEYYATAEHILAYGAAEISLVGSSRGKEAIVMPDLAVALKHVGYAANYSCAGARADEVRAIGDFLLRHGTPHLVLCEVTPRAFLEDDPRWARSAFYWGWSDWWTHFREDRATALRVWPVVMRNAFGEWWRTLRYRHKPAVLADDLWLYYKRQRAGLLSLTPGEFLAGRTRPSPLSGELTERQAFDDFSLVTRPVPDEHVRDYVSPLLTAGQYPMGKRRLREMLAFGEACRARSVPLVFYEVPVASILRRHLPADVYPRFYERMERIARTTGATFLPIDSLHVEFEDADFAEQSHLNRHGATKLTRALVARLAPNQSQVVESR